ncbi:hypothetical protein EYR38_003387 [Pleurotus pulmonarius]|nr:hypothetical protein EYR38_003387 [Pleurotus pulmonarius]
MSIGNIRNNVRRAHRQGVIPVAFLAIPKADRKYDNDTEFQKFKRHLYHTSIAAVFQSLKPHMTKPVVRRCPDGHYRRVIFDFGPFIGDYPEQVLLAGVAQNWCARCTALNIDLDSPELAGRREQAFTDHLVNTLPPVILWDEYGIDSDVVIIKGTFKDHLVTWVAEYLVVTHGKADASLRRFKDGRRFKQWTGDDSKGLMKVYLPALVGFVPPGIIQALHFFLEFCYIVRRPSFTPDTLAALDDALRNFHLKRTIFQDTGVRKTISLPRQHSMVHYHHLIEEFGAPNGLCSSITESRHITAVKKPWRRSSRWEALGQMLTTNQRLDKLLAMRTDFISRNMLPLMHDKPPPPPVHPPDILADDEECAPTDDIVEGSVVLARTRIRTYPRRIAELAEYIGYPQLHELTRRFLYDHLYPNARFSSNEIPLNDCPSIDSKTSVYHSAIATFFAPSDSSGIYGMRRERIRSTPSWRGTGKRRDCAFVVEDQNVSGFNGLSVVRVLLLFSFRHKRKIIPCAFIQWFRKYGQHSDSRTGMWVVRPETSGPREMPVYSVIHIDCILRAAHLIPVFGLPSLPLGFKHTWSLDAFKAFYVNKYVDHHAHELLS